VLTLVLIANELNIKLMGKKTILSAVNKKDENNNSEAIKLMEAPGPKKKFLIGNLDALSGYEIPYQAFSALERQYGKIIKLQLGMVPAMVINGVEAIKEVTVTKGHHFDARPNFKRYHQLFSGNKENCKCLNASLFRAGRFILTLSISIGILRLV
jgi:cytochrome P450 family 307 subfamily A